MFFKVLAYSGKNSAGHSGDEPGISTISNAALCVGAVNCTRRKLMQSSVAAALLFTLTRTKIQADDKCVNLYADDNLSAYGFPDGHPLGIDRQGAFLREAIAQGPDRRHDQARRAGGIAGRIAAFSQ